MSRKLGEKEGNLQQLKDQSVIFSLRMQGVKKGKKGGLTQNPTDLKCTYIQVQRLYI